MKKSLKETAPSAKQGELVIVNAANLAKAGTTGVVAAGIFEGSKPNKYNPAKNDYRIRGLDNTLYIIDETKALREQFDQLAGIENASVEVVYNGKLATKNGKGFHDFEVFLN